MMKSVQPLTLKAKSGIKKTRRKPAKSKKTNPPSKKQTTSVGRDVEKSNIITGDGNVIGNQNQVIIKKDR